MALTLSAPILQNGQTHSNNSSALSTNCSSVFDHFVGLALKGLSLELVGTSYLSGFSCNFIPFSDGRIT